MRIAAVFSALAAGAATLAAAAAHAQVDRRYAEEPTSGLDIPTTPLAGEQDARATTYNPGGLALLRGPELELALDLQDPDVATSAGPGFGIFFGTSGGGSLVPHFGFGLGFEWLRPARAQLAPDPGQPFRFTMSYALGLGPNGGLGFAWHHFIAEGPLSGLDTFDLGLSARFGNHLALGATLRDISSVAVAMTPVQRRYELEAAVRPFTTDVLEVAVGGRIGEIRGDLDGWGRFSLRATRGLYVLGALETRDLHALVDSPTGVLDIGGRDYRATVGFELSFGGFAATALGTGLRDDARKNHALGGTLVLRTGAVLPPSVLGRTDHIERVELSGDIGGRQLTALVVRLREIARDSSAKGLVVVFDGASGGWASLQELRDEILAVKGAGKKVFAYFVSATGRDYFIASAADKIYVDPAGALRLVGMAGTTLYFRGAFDHLGVVPQFEKIGEYKSAPEQFTNTGPSAIAAKMHDDLFDSLWDQWLAAVAAGRHLSIEEMKALVDAGPYTAGDLDKSKKLVDAVATPERISQLITAELGAGYEVGVPPIERPDRWDRPGVAVIYVDGDITDGKSQKVPLLGQSLVGGETIVEAITAARNDPRIKAIILRIDSPGGSALASELISREVFATRGVKPIVCSMSNLAASGGYFVAAGCDVIFAEPMTITGSIGIFYGKFDLGGLLAKVGVTTETYKRGNHSDIESLFRPYTAEERTVLLDKLRYMYSRFVGAVAEGRKLTKQAVDDAGRGHVYTGAQARPLKLVDRYGGLGDAIEEVKSRIGLSAGTRVRLYELPKPPSSVLGALGNLLGVHADAAPSILDVPVIRAVLHDVPASLLVSPEGAQARLPFDISWE
ncbi:MAG: signal peptide peptidase SppA, type [Myxococcales bacterium]|nr:signal peptide peptidase SppA, type [Myxococcales bacterium]